MKLLIFSVLFVAVTGIPEGKKAEGTKKPPHEMTTVGKLKSIENLLIEVIKDVHVSEKGYVPHEEIEKPGEKIIDLLIKAIKPVKKVVRLSMKDAEICNEKLDVAFFSGKNDREIALLAGQCFFVVHRPFIVLLRQAFEKGLFAELYGKGKKREKRNVYPLMHELREIDHLLGRFRDGKLDLPYVIKFLRVMRTQSQLSRDTEDLIVRLATDYFELAYRLLYLIHAGHKDGAQIWAGIFYLSNMRKIAKVETILKYYRKGGEGNHGEGHHHTEQPTGKPFTGGPHHTGKTFTGGHHHTGKPFTGGHHHTGKPFTGGAHHTGKPFTGGAHHTGKPFTGGAHHTGKPFTGGHHHTGKPFTAAIAEDSNDWKNFDLELFELKNK